jgi:hypothetical protein
MLGQDVGALLGFGRGRPAQDLALLFCLGYTRLSTRHQQIPLELSDGRKHAQHHLASRRSPIPCTQFQHDHLNAAHWCSSASFYPVGFIARY